MSSAAVALALLLQSAPSPAAAAPPARSEVVVTGHPLPDTENALKACIARHCLPDEDIRATLAHAENQFVGGDYKQARGTLLAAIGRNKRFAARYPVPVSDLLRAQSRVAIHLGEADSFRIGQIDALDALRAGLPARDPRILAQRIEVADAFSQLGQQDEALLQYRAVVADAHAAGETMSEGYALLRRASLLATLADVDPGVYEPDARRAITVLARTTDPVLAPFRLAAELLTARRAARAGDTAAIDRLIARFGTPGRTPHLIYAPPLIEQDSTRSSLDELSSAAGSAFQTSMIAASGSATARMSLGQVEDNWVDIGFWVRPDGHVGDVDALRTSASVERGWVEALKKNIAARRYSPTTADKGDPGLLRVERYTRTAHQMFDRVGSHLRQREAIPRTEVLDLTAVTNVAPAAVSAPAGTS